MISNLQIDQALLILYFIITLCFGLYKKSNYQAYDYLFAGRKLTTPALIATLVSTWYGGILEIGRFTYEYGIITWIIFGLFYYIAAVLYVKYIVSKIIEHKISTIPSLFHNFHGKIPAIIATLCVLLLTTPAPYIKILSSLFQYTWAIPILWALILSSFLSILYAFTGGFSSIVRTDKLQFVLMFSGFLLILCSSFYQYGGINFLIHNTPEYAFRIPGKLNWTYVLVWSFIALITFIDPSFYQRTFAGNSLESVKKGILLSIFFWIIFDFMTIFTGIYALAILPINSVNPYLDLSKVVLSPIGQGLFMVSLFAIVMSTIDSFTFISAITIGKDMPLLFGHKNKNFIYYIRFGLLFTSISSIIIAYNFEHAIEIWYLVGSFVVPTLLIPIIITLYNIKVKYISFLMILPLMTSFVWYILNQFNLFEDLINQDIANLDPMYPGLIISIILFYILKK